MNFLDIYNLSDYITKFHEEYIRDHGLEWHEIDETYDDYETLVNDAVNNGYMTISLAFCNNTIYRYNSDNVLFRVVHDHLHIINRLSFSIVDEAILGTKQVALFTKWMLTQDIPNEQRAQVVRLYQNDILGQLSYLEEFGDFPSNQLQFALNYFNHATLVKVSA